MESDLHKVHKLVSKLLTELNHYRAENKVLCRCDLCEKPDVPVWERKNFCSRGNANLHARNQRSRKRQRESDTRSHKDQSFWKPCEVADLFRREALAALQEEQADQLSQLSNGKKVETGALAVHPPYRSHSLHCAEADEGGHSAAEEPETANAGMADADQADSDSEDEPMQDAQDVTSPQQAADSQPSQHSQPSSNSQPDAKQSAWAPPAAHVSKDIGLVGCFADKAYEISPPQAEFEKLLPGKDGSVLVRASPKTIA